MAVQWLDGIAKQDNVVIRHGGEHGITIPEPDAFGKSYYRCDGYCEETNTVYEFDGDYWHGNPAKSDPDEEHPMTHLTYGEMYARTLVRHDMIRKHGYNLVTIWESDYKIQLREST